jgi:5-formaminoimidazole-4-carboxamide-1-(beta)-D-ribofuranosyl 5'-monophosphate synthetase
MERILKDYDQEKIAIGTIGSHSALNIFKGAKEEGFKTVCVCKKNDQITYERFRLADEFIIVNDFKELINEEVQQKLRQLNTILIPHGSFNAYLNLDEMTNKLQVPMFGNRQLLLWEIDREKQKEWLEKAGLKLPRTFNNPKEIDRPVMIKFPGAKGGKGYFLASSSKSFFKKATAMIKRGLIKKEDIEKIHIQEYIIGVNIYPSYFHSIMKKEVELLCVDRRYESTVDAIGRIIAQEQLELDLNPTYTIVGNFPVTLRESLLAEYIRMGDQVVKVSEQIAPPGIIGPFCLETIVTDAPEIYTFEISARIVAGTNTGIGGSPYSYLKYGKEMYMGKRIAIEIKTAIAENRLNEVVT